MALSDWRMLDSLSRMPFIDSAELAGVLGEPHATIHRALAGLLADGIAGRVSHGAAHLPSSQRYYLTANGIRQAAELLGFATPSDFVRAYPASIRRMADDAHPPDGRRGLRLSSRSIALPRHRRPAVARGVPPQGPLRRRHHAPRRPRLRRGPRQGLALRRRSLYDRLRAIAEYDYTRRPDTILILVPSMWEQRLTTRFCEERNLRECFVAVESRGALESRGLRLWCCTSWVIGSRFFSLEAVSARASPGGGPRTESPERERASLPRPERMVEAAPAFGISPSEKRTLDLVTDHPMIPREHLACWLGVSEGRVSQMMHSLVDTWGLVEQRGKRGDTRYTLSAEGIRYVTHRDRAQLPTTQGIWSTALTTDKQGRRRHVGHRIETWARQTKHADGITWFLSKLEAEARADPRSELVWSVPTARSDRAYNWGDSAIAPDAVGEMIAEGLRIPFYFEYELRARHPQGVIARLDPYESYYWSPEYKEDQPPFPVTLFVVDTEDVEATYVRTAARMSRMSLPNLRVLRARSVPHRDTGTFLASTVGAGIPETAAVHAETVPVGLPLPPDASCRG